MSAETALSRRLTDKLLELQTHWRQTIQDLASVKIGRIEADKTAERLIWDHLDDMYRLDSAHLAPYLKDIDAAHQTRAKTRANQTETKKKADDPPEYPYRVCILENGVLIAGQGFNTLSDARDFLTRIADGKTVYVITDANNHILP